MEVVAKKSLKALVITWKYSISKTKKMRVDFPPQVVNYGGRRMNMMKRETQFKKLSGKGLRPSVAAIVLFLGVIVTSTAFAQPANDDFDSATVISVLPFTDSINTMDATKAADDPYSCYGYWYGHTVWYSFTPTENMRIGVDISGSDYMIFLTAYTGSRGALSQTACVWSWWPTLMYTNASQPIYFMVGSYGSEPGGNLKLKVNAFPPLTINLSIDPVGSVNRLTGDAMIHGTLTSSRPVSGRLSGELRQRAGRFEVISGSLNFSFNTANATTWNATVRGSNGPFNAGQASATAFASGSELSWPWDFAADDASAVVHLRGKER